MPSDSAQTRSQSPALQTWHSLDPLHAPLSVCILWWRMSSSRVSVVFSRMRVMTVRSWLVSLCFFYNRLMSLRNIGANSETSIALYS